MLNGVRVAGADTVNNSIRGNSIHANGLLGIDLGGDGVTLNDPMDPDVGPNRLQNFPELAAVVETSGGSARVRGTLDSRPLTTFTIDFYASAAADPSGYGEGQRWLAAIEVVTDDAGMAAIDHVLAMVSSDEFLTATATDDQAGTSEFSALGVRIGNEDLNQDGQVGREDVAVQLFQFGLSSGAEPNTGDLDADGDIDLYDLIALQLALEPANAPSAAAPASIIRASAGRGRLGVSSDLDGLFAEREWRQPASLAARNRTRISRRHANALPADQVDASLGDFGEIQMTDGDRPVLRARRTSRSHSRGA
jgi:hypothetical protein